MPERHQIRCIRKSDRYNPHERITHIGGLNADGTRWLLPLEDALTGIESGRWSFFVSAGGHIVNVVVAIRLGRQYLKTESDGEQPDNLLALPECP